MQKDPNDPQYNSGSEQEIVRPPRDPRSMTPVYGEEGRPETALNLDDSRSLSSHHCPSDSGYHSSGALSDGPNTLQVQTYEQGYHTTSSIRSVGSVGSQGSTEREARLHTTSSMRSVGSIGSQGSSSAFHRGPPGRVMIAAHLVSGETRFPTAMSYTTAEAPKSDIATVCSGSVIEDIEVSSVMSGGSNPPQTPNIPMQSSDRMVVVSAGARRTSSGGVGQAQQRVVDFAPQPHAPGISATRSQYAHPPVRSSPTLPPATEPVGASAIAMMNDMGPPLSRTLLLQDPPMASQGDSSRAGSVRSFGSTAGASSDVVAHVDTDDCGGSLVESVNDGNSVKSQEGNRSGSDEATEKSEVDDAPSGGGDSPTHPLLQDDTSSSRTNCRTSPGGTVYKGRGTRRYQGRYMHLPLKRFHQNGVTMEEETRREPGEPTNGCYAEPPNGLYTEPPNGRYSEPKNGCYANDYDPGRGYGHATRDWTRQRSRSRSPPQNERRNGNYRNRKRSWSRSRSQSRSRSRSCSPPTHTQQDNRSPVADRTRSGRKSNRHKKRSSPTRHKSHRTRGERYPRSNGRSNRSESPSNGRSSSRSHQRYNRKKNGNSHGRRNSRT